MPSERRAPAIQTTASVAGTGSSATRSDAMAPRLAPATTTHSAPFSRRYSTAPMTSCQIW